MSQQETRQDESPGTEFAIVINGSIAVVPHQDVAYIEVVSIAYPDQVDGATYTVTYRNAEAPRHEGILVAGQVVKVKKEGTVFNVVHTGKS